MIYLDRLFVFLLGFKGMSTAKGQFAHIYRQSQDDLKIHDPYLMTPVTLRPKIHGIYQPEVCHLSYALIL